MIAQETIPRRPLSFTAFTQEDKFHCEKLLQAICSFYLVAHYASHPSKAD